MTCDVQLTTAQVCEICHAQSKHESAADYYAKYAEVSTTTDLQHLT